MVTVLISGSTKSKLSFDFLEGFVCHHLCESLVALGWHPLKITFTPGFCANNSKMIMTFDENN